MRRLIVMVVFFFLFFAVDSAVAQGGSGQPPSGAAAQGEPLSGGGAMMGSMSAEDEAESLSAQLNLTADQEAKILDVLKAREAGKLKVQENFPVAQPGSPPSADGIAAMDKVMAAARDGILNVLNDEQKVKYEAINPVSAGGPPGN